MTALTPTRHISLDRSSFVTPPRSSAGAAEGAAAAESVVHIQSSLAASPAYATNYKKHSLYGFEDRVVIDPGSRIWKIGFSGESEPRKVFWPINQSEDSLWDMDLNRMAEEMKGSVKYLPLQMDEMEEEEDPFKDEKEIKKLIRARLMKAFKDAFIKHLLAESFKRKVIVLENAMLPKPIKELITDILIQNLEVPSVTFLPVHMTAPLALGRTSALVVDIGHLETSVLPVVASRLIQSCLSVTPIAGRPFLRRLRILILRYGQYKPPSSVVRPVASPSKQTSLNMDSSDMNSATEEHFGNVPPFILTRDVLEDIRIRGCFVAPPISNQTTEEHEDDPMKDLPDYNTTSDALTEEDSNLAEGLNRKYSKTATVPDATFRCPHDEKTGRSIGTLSVPGWIRERSAEIFFEKGDEDRSSVVETILETLLKTPVDLRAEMASSILIIGGGGMLQGFIPRLRLELLAALMNTAILPQSSTDPFVTGSRDDVAAVAAGPTPATPPTPKLQARRSEVYLAKTMLANRFTALRGLRDRIAILNDVTPDETAEDSPSGSAPAWSAGLMSWVGGSMAGALQVSGKEIMPPGAPKDRDGKNLDPARSTQPHRTRDRADHELSQAQRQDLTHQAERRAARRREIAAIPRNTHRVR